jgi:hypothetical protein
MSPLKLYLPISASNFEKICLSKSLFCTNEELDNNYITDSVHVLRNTQVHQNTNNYGKSIIELCSDSQLRILNGRTLGDSVGKATYFNYSGVIIKMKS